MILPGMTIGRAKLPKGSPGITSPLQSVDLMTPTAAGGAKEITTSFTILGTDVKGIMG
jgi:hypothetical protein